MSTNGVLRDEIKEKCFVNCIISLPTKTFFNTPKKTYILGITKKSDEKEKQDYPVFTYLVSSIGETLDIDRIEIESNDLDKAKNLFNQYKGSQKTFKTDDNRCKLIPLEEFLKEKYWTVEKWWSKEEKLSLGILEENEIISIDEFRERLVDLSSKIKKYERILAGL